jgi:hypothetical protein
VAQDLRRFLIVVGACRRATAGTEAIMTGQAIRKTSASAVQTGKPNGRRMTAPASSPTIGPSQSRRSHGVTQYFEFSGFGDAGVEWPWFGIFIRPSFIRRCPKSIAELLSSPQPPYSTVVIMPAAM